MAKIQAIGFGYMPKETQHHFLVRLTKSKESDVTVYERFGWDESADQQLSDLTEKNLKVIIKRDKWDDVKEFIEKEFNRRLKIDNIVIGKFKCGDTPIERLLGKELILLLWAIEDSDNKLTGIAIKNWLGLSQEERWWLFTMTNATTGNYIDKRGWKTAIRYALTENPVTDRDVQGNITKQLYKQL